MCVKDMQLDRNRKEKHLQSLEIMVISMEECVSSWVLKKTETDMSDWTATEEENTGSVDCR